MKYYFLGKCGRPEGNGQNLKTGKIVQSPSCSCDTVRNLAKKRTRTKQTKRSKQKKVKTDNAGKCSDWKCDKNDKRKEMTKR